MKKMDETLSLVLSKEDNKIIKNKIQNVVNTYNVLTDTIKKDQKLKLKLSEEKKALIEERKKIYSF